MLHLKDQVKLAALNQIKLVQTRSGPHCFASGLDSVGSEMLELLPGTPRRARATGSVKTWVTERSSTIWWRMRQIQYWTILNYTELLIPCVSRPCDTVAFQEPVKQQGSLQMIYLIWYIIFQCLGPQRSRIRHVIKGQRILQFPISWIKRFRAFARKCASKRPRASPWNKSTRSGSAAGFSTMRHFSLQNRCVS